jgi:acyl-homoserine lactone acylase PvdQ
VKRPLALSIPLVLLLTLSGVRATTPAETGRFYNILPPGENGSTNAVQGLQFLGQGQRPPHSDDQLAMYADLVYNSPGLAEADVTKYYKKAGFTVDPDDVTRMENPREGVTIVRDQFGVPHIYGDTAADVVWATGYVTGEDRLFLTDVLRNVGRGRLSELLGASEANLAMDRSLARVAGYTEEELQLQVDLLPVKFGPLGTLSRQAFAAFTAGMNAWITEALTDPTKLPAEYPALQILPKPWRETDIVAVATLIQAVFAAGGGGELSNAHLKNELAKKFAPATAEAVFRDLLNRDDPDAPTTIPDAFVFQPPEPVNPAAVAVPDEGSVEIVDPLQTLRDQLAAIGLNLPGAMSNWLAVNGNETADGHPIAVMGPQTGYFSPQLLMEVDMHGGGIDARGATFPGISLAVLLGRGIDFAWSATSGESDIVDVRVEKLCESDGSPPTSASTSYLIHGVCAPMYERTDRWVAKPSAGSLEENGFPAEPTIVTQTVERTAHGPVFGRATVNGAPVALVIQRSTFFGEADSSPAFQLLNTNQVHDPQTFFEAMNYVTGSFNWLYVDDDDVAYFHSGLYPRRAAGVDHELPVWGTGDWEWNGFLGLEEHPHTANPAAGYIASWNNKPAPAWRAADANYSYSPVYRVQSLTERLRSAVQGPGIGITDMIDIMEDAATVDLRGSQVLPHALQVLGSDPGTDAYTALLEDWVASGAHRRAPSRAEPYDRQAAIALLDAWYEPMIHAIFDDELGGIYDDIPLGFDDGNRAAHLGSAFQGGYYGHLQKALKTRLHHPVGAPYSVLACGNSLKDCRALLKASLLAAVSALEEEFGGGPESWTVDKAIDDIRHSAVGLVNVPAIDWQNRPTFQQVVQVLQPRS